MNRRAVIKKVEREAKRQGVAFSIVEMTRHTGIVVGSVRSGLGRHNEIPSKPRRPCGNSSSLS